MPSIKSTINQNIVNPLIKNNYEKVTLVAEVTNTHEENNMVDIIYLDRKGNKTNKENVVVRLYGSGTDWFPSVKDKVLIEESQNTCVVIARHIGNYNMDVRSNMEIKQDIYSDKEGCRPAGGSIM